MTNGIRIAGSRFATLPGKGGSSSDAPKADRDIDMARVKKYAALMGFVFPCLVESSSPVVPLEKPFATPTEQGAGDDVEREEPAAAAPFEMREAPRSSATFG